MRSKVISALAKGGFALYRYLISPAIHLIAGPGYGCRFYPSCSEYAREAYEAHGFWQGTRLSIRRVLRCHPGARGRASTR